ncbi:oxidosqualene:lanosterol cyclase [Eremomyces bilateralis CBS 781.70]|uniref:Terpene cyclase/mutase family member n=1 Tax=Eremomyces bilateralis CBS 781.70 TaxID=1392243 RepID=A0A6G1G290_9PEZI|nr:oxidosqualene:lanosterol cyclase [Eremomyces bilateralis CBS 781.70]KAF1812174.1 oxidosqualene:lanosterol cyclase [Eremomyces bilateralis CBS 781.70]
MATKKRASGAAKEKANGSAKKATGTQLGESEKTGNGRAIPTDPQADKTDYSRWRMLDDGGRQTWQYLRTDEEVAKWPQTAADKYFLGLDTGAPEVPPAKTPIASVNNALSFFSRLQSAGGSWACEYGGPMFLLPGLVITWYVTETPIPAEHAIEMKNYLFARQHKVDGGWGLHIEGDSSVFGTSMNYTCLRLLGADPEDPRMVKARGTLHKMGGAIYGPHWAKFWLSVLGVMQWDIVNPVPPELWLLPDWTPISPWRWWIHMRMVFLPMSFVSSKKWSYPLTPLTEALRKELFPQPYESIKWSSNRNSISKLDEYYPKSWLLNTVNTVFVNIWNPFLRINRIKKAAEDWTWKLIQYEDLNTGFANLGPVNGPMNLLSCYIQEGSDAESVKLHREHMEDFLWVKDEGMLMNGTNGVQSWDTAFAMQAIVYAGLGEDPRWQPVVRKGLAFLETQQIREDAVDMEKCYRHPRKGAWGFSNKLQGYAVSDCTAEGLKSVIMAQALPGIPELISHDRLRQAADILLTYQNADTGACSSYETRRGGHWLELLNAAEVFGNIMVEYDYPECTTAVVIGLTTFRKFDPDYRTAEIEKLITRAVAWIRTNQRPDGSWYGSWGICFTYAGMFALEALAAMGETHESSEAVRRGCAFLMGKQRADGGWGESYKSCEDQVWTEHENTQVVQTCWAVIGLMYAEYPDKEPIERALRMVMRRQQKNGEWLQEAIEGVFNKSCMISYPNYKFIFPIKALGMYAEKYGDVPLL